MASLKRSKNVIEVQIIFNLTRISHRYRLGMAKSIEDPLAIQTQDSDEYIVAQRKPLHAIVPFIITTRYLTASDS